uniref:RING-type domain-containing protein n=1 Tax=Ananas comosus var. bracteatus TaxID=296719 RepID=A0A6V7PX47_ANACO|nr:unnamed protein product [Ananas comosus var. bracteatus]
MCMLRDDAPEAPGVVPPPPRLLQLLILVPPPRPRPQALPPCNAPPSLGRLRPLPPSNIAHHRRRRPAAAAASSSFPATTASPSAAVTETLRVVRYFEIFSKKQQQLKQLTAAAAAAAAAEEENAVCAVCLEEFAGEHRVRELGNCDHAFHAACIDRWAETGAATCPLCRSPLQPTSPQRRSRETPGGVWFRR